MPLDGVAETSSNNTYTECQNQYAGLCQDSVLSGLLSCQTDLCPGCTKAGMCDLTCGFCDSVPAHRRAQLTPGQGDAACTVSDFPNRVTAFEEACCDGSTGPSTAIPTTCDAQCAFELGELLTCHAISVDHD